MISFEFFFKFSTSRFIACVLWAPSKTTNGSLLKRSILPGHRDFFNPFKTSFLGKAAFPIDSKQNTIRWLLLHFQLDVALKAEWLIEDLSYFIKNSNTSPTSHQDADSLFYNFPVYIKRCIFALAVCWMTVKASGAIFPVTTGTPCLMIPAFVQRFLQLYLQVFRYDQVNRCYSVSIGTATLVESNKPPKPTSIIATSTFFIKNNQMPLLLMSRIQ